MPSFALLVDLDGTLADTLPICLTAYRIALARHTGKVYSDAEITAHFGVSEDGVLQRIAPDCWQQCFSTFLQEFECVHDVCSAPFTGLPELIRSLRSRGVRVGMVTGRGREATAVSFLRLGLNDLFEEVRTGSPVADVKTQRIAELLRVFQVSGDHAAYLGDVPTDMRAARENGIRALAAAWAPSANVEALLAERPDASLRSVPELGRWIERWLSGSELHS